MWLCQSLLRTVPIPPFALKLSRCSGNRYTHNATRARTITLPLLEGLNAWGSCYLQKVPDKNGSFTFLDYVAASPDEEHEGQKVPNPQIALALMLRVATAHVEIGEALGVTVPQ